MRAIKLIKKSPKILKEVNKLIKIKNNHFNLNKIVAL